MDGVFLVFIGSCRPINTGSAERRQRVGSLMKVETPREQFHLESMYLITLWI